jgi:dipeptidyl-peptidase-4
MLLKFASPAVLLVAFTFPSWALDVGAEMKRVEDGKKSGSLVYRDELKFYWSSGDGPLMYRVDTGRNVYRFYQVDTTTGTKSEAFDHDLFAKALDQAVNQLVEPSRLPIDDLDSLHPGSIRFRAFGKSWQYSASGHSISPDNQLPKNVELIDPEIAMKDTRNNGDATSHTIKNLSPDEYWRAVIINHNLLIEPTAGGKPISLTTNGSKDDGYSPPFHWSPDSKKLVAFRSKSVKTRQITIVQSSPPDQLQPKLKVIDYPKPGDPISQPMPHLFTVNEAREIPLDETLFANPWKISEAAWRDDSTEFSFVYNQRGHQVMRVVGIGADSGSARTILEEVSRTFIDYSQKFFLHRLPATGEFLWASERDGFNRLYLIDGRSGQVKNAVTQGSMIVKEVVQVDDEKRQLLLKVVGLPDQDPYHEHFVRVNFDGTEMIHHTTGDGTHQIDFSPDQKWIIDRWSRVDQPQVVELRRAADGKRVSEIERADDSELIKLGWSRPERFVAKGRDGETDIHGIIIRPVNFDPNKKYPVLEDIYAGPHDHFVPKAYSAWSRRNAMADLGFIVVNIDGMGTNWRSRKFHDVCWKNLADSGFPDRIPWIKVAAASRPWMDLSRVGIYGGSAGGQSTLAGLLHHSDFYKVGVADCGCHDNRMDKIWWNEAWMGWPVDESYERNANVTHAAKLKGKLLLVVGEMDTNVDPASTAQVVSALQKADKDFEFLPIMNAGHGAAETPYGKWRRAEFLMRNLGVIR